MQLPSTTRAALVLIVSSIVSVAQVAAQNSGQQHSLHLRTSHAAAVTHLRFDRSHNRLFSAGTDGKLLVWDAATDRLLQSIRVDGLPIRDVALYPDGTQVAVYTSDGRRDHRVSVWNWTTGERRFLHRPEEELLAFGVSPQGNYLYYTTPTLTSINLLDGRTGNRLPFLRDATGIVSWVVVANSEERMLIYVPSTGRLQYRSIVTGRVESEFQGPAGLQHITVFASRRYAAAQNAAGMLVLVDLLSGRIVSEVAAGEIQRIVYDQETDEVLVLSRTFGAAPGWRRYQIGETGLRQRFESDRRMVEEITAYVPAGRALYAGTGDGTIYRWAAFESTPLLFADSIIRRAADLTVDGNRLTILAGSHVLSVTSDLLTRRSTDVGQTSFVRHSVAPFTADARARFLETDNGNPYLWVPGTTQPLLTYQPFSSTTSPAAFENTGTLVSATFGHNHVVTTARNGTVAVFEPGTDRPVFTYRGVGIQTALLTNRGLLIGKSSQGLLDSSLVRVDVSTGETVPIAVESNLVLSIRYDSNRSRIFVVGIRTVANRTTTILELIEGRDFTQRRTLIEVNGEFLDGDMAVDPTNGNVFTTLDDRGGILRWDGARMRELYRNPAHVPHSLHIGGDFLYVVNRDGTVSVFDRVSGELAMDLYLVGRAQTDVPPRWLVIRPDGTFFTPYDELATIRYLSSSAQLPLPQLRLVISSPTAPIHRPRAIIPGITPVIPPPQGQQPDSGVSDPAFRPFSF